VAPRGMVEGERETFVRPLQVVGNTGGAGRGKGSGESAVQNLLAGSQIPNHLGVKRVTIKKQSFQFIYVCMYVQVCTHAHIHMFLSVSGNTGSPLLET
jgi:hypothetical protein